MTIQLDISDCSVVVLCSDCPWWQCFAWTEAAAERVAITHEDIAHDGRIAFKKRIQKRGQRARHAATTSIVATHPDSSRRGITRQTRTRQTRTRQAH